MINMPLEKCFQAVTGIVTGRLAKRTTWDIDMQEADWRNAMKQVADQDVVKAIDAILVDIENPEVGDRFGHVMANFIVHHAIDVSKIDPKKAKNAMRIALRHGRHNGFSTRYARVATQLGMGPIR